MLSLFNRYDTDHECNTQQEWPQYYKCTYIASHSGLKTHRDRKDSLRAQPPINAGELALTLAAAILRFKCDFGGDDHGREAG